MRESLIQVGPSVTNSGRPFKKGDQIVVVLTGAGVTSREEGHEVLRVSKGVAYTSDDAYPHYDAATGKWLGDDFAGFSRRIERAA